MEPKNGRTDADAVAKARKLLESLIVMAGMERQEIDRRMGVSRGFTSQVLTGRVQLKFHHVLDFLEVLKVAPSTFFQILFPAPGEAGGQAAMMQRFLGHLQQPGGGGGGLFPGDAAQLKPMIEAAVRQALEEREAREEEAEEGPRAGRRRR